MLSLKTFPTERKQPSTISRLYVFFYLSRRRLWLISSLLISAALFLVSLALTLGRPTVENLSGWLVLASWSGTATSVVASVLGLLEKWKLATAPGVVANFDQNEFELSMSNLALPDELVNSGYEVIRGGVANNILTGYSFTGASAVSHKVNRCLWQMRDTEFDVAVPAECRTILGGYKQWPFPSRQDPIISPTVGQLSQTGSLANERKIRLREDIHPTQPFGGITIEKTDYLSDIATGAVTGTRFKDTLGMPVYDGYELAFTRPGVVKPCRDSSCSNQIGVSSLLVVVEQHGGHALKGRFFIVDQAAGNVHSTGLLAPSGSGSLDWSDFMGYGKSFVHSGMVRELLEETTNGNWWELGDQASLVLTGFGRMLHRGGKPEFYGLVVMPGSNHTLGIDKSEADFVKDFVTFEVNPLSADNLSAALIDYDANYKARFSHPLFLAIKFAIEYLKEHKDQFDEYLARTYTCGRPGEPSAELNRGRPPGSP